MIEIIDYIHPAFWSDQEMNWDKPSAQQCKYVDALRLAIIEREESIRETKSSLRHPDYIPTPSRVRNKGFLLVFESRIHALISKFTNTKKVTTNEIDLSNLPLWSRRDILDELGESYVNLQPYNMENDAWLKQQYKILNLLALYVDYDRSVSVSETEGRKGQPPEGSDDYSESVSRTYSNYDSNPWGSLGINNSYESVWYPRYVYKRSGVNPPNYPGGIYGMDVYRIRSKFGYHVDNFSTCDIEASLGIIINDIGSSVSILDTELVDNIGDIFSIHTAIVTTRESIDISKVVGDGDRPIVPPDPGIGGETTFIGHKNGDLVETYKFISIPPQITHPFNFYSEVVQ